MSPASLANALDAGCGTRPTVVVVSACHSGIFLAPAMRRPNRIVLAAARADRGSFGCGTDDQYTYYDQCLLQQFDGAATWRSLAGHAELRRAGRATHGRQSAVTAADLRRRRGEQPQDPGRSESSALLDRGPPGPRLSFHAPLPPSGGGHDILVRSPITAVKSQVTWFRIVGAERQRVARRP